MPLTVEDSKLFNLSDSWLLLKLSLISVFVKKEHGKKSTVKEASSRVLELQQPTILEYT